MGGGVRLARALGLIVLPLGLMLPVKVAFESGLMAAFLAAAVVAQRVGIEVAGRIFSFLESVLEEGFCLGEIMVRDVSS